MLKNIKNIRKLDNAKLLLVSSDKNILSVLDSEFIAEFSEFTHVETGKEAIEASKSNGYDILIIDTNIDGDFKNVASEITLNSPVLPKIVISDSSEESNIITAINCSAYTFMSKPLRSENVKLAIIMCLNLTKRGDKIDFQEGIYFDEYRDQFFKHGGALLDFTKLEKSFLKLLIANKGRVTDYDEIKETVWKGKNMSIFTMRNIVNKIRQKTYYEIIRNYSNKGYVIDDYKK